MRPFLPLLVLFFIIIPSICGVIIQEGSHFFVPDGQFRDVAAALNAKAEAYLTQQNNARRSSVPYVVHCTQPLLS